MARTISYGPKPVRAIEVLLYLHPSSFEFTHFVPMEFPIKFDSVKSGWFITYFKGWHVILS